MRFGAEQEFSAPTKLVVCSAAWGTAPSLSPAIGAMPSGTAPYEVGKVEFLPSRHSTLLRPLSSGRQPIPRHHLRGKPPCGGGGK
jgi:hypothetical protein